MEDISELFKVSSTLVINVYNFCNDFRVLIDGLRIDGIVFCYFSADIGVFDVGAVDSKGNFRHFRVPIDRVTFCRYVMG